MKFQPFDKFLVLAVLAASVLVAAPTVADDTAKQTDAKEQWRTVIKATNHVDVDEARDVLNLLGVTFAVKPDQNLIVLRGPGPAIDTALKVVDALDVPRPSIDIRVFVLAASKEGKIDVPDNLEGTVDHLRGVFGFNGFELLDTVMLRVLEGRRGQVDGGIQVGDDTARRSYHFGFQKVSVVSEEFLYIRLKGLEFAVDGKIGGTVSARLKTDVQIREGQKAVIGSSTPNGVGDTLVLIVEATASPDPSRKMEANEGG